MMQKQFSFGPQPLSPWRMTGAALLLSLSLVACGGNGSTGGGNGGGGGGGGGDNGPVATQPGGPSPSKLNPAVVPAPKLTGSGDEAKQTVAQFVDWAADSTLSQREEGRAAIEAARSNDAVAQALVDELFAAQKTDHSRALVVLSVLGELRNPVGEAGLTKFVQLPFPTGTPTDGYEGEIPEQTALGTLQAKAAEGLAYMGTGSADETVLNLIATHPSRIVRAAAITAYLYNQGDNADSRGTLSQYVQKGEAVFIDRPIHDIGESGEVFNRKLQLFLKLHPELIAPDPPLGEGGEPAPQPALPVPGTPPER